MTEPVENVFPGVVVASNGPAADIGFEAVDIGPGLEIDKLGRSGRLLSSSDKSFSSSK